MRYISLNRPKLHDEDFDVIISYATKEGFSTPSNPTHLLRLIIDMKAIGLWSDLDAFYVFAGDGDNDFKCINIVSPGNFNAMPVNSPVFSDAGVAGGLTNGYISTGINPTNTNLKSKQNNAMIMAVVANAVTGGGASNPYSTIWGLESSFEDAFSTYRRWRRLNGSFQEEDTVGEPGLFAIARTGASSGWATQKGVEQTLVNSSNALLNDVRTILRQWTNYGRGTVSCYGSGASVSQSVMQEFREKYNKYLQGIGQSEIA